MTSTGVTRRCEKNKGGKKRDAKQGHTEAQTSQHKKEKPKGGINGDLQNTTKGSVLT